MATATAAPYPARASSALAGYLPAFQGHEAEPFITLHPVSNAPGQSTPPPPTTLTRGALWALASRLARALKEGHGLGKGARVLHLFKGNSIEDVALRLAASMIGTVPVTVNWESDPIDRVLYKIRSSGARLVLTHAHTPAEQIAAATAAVESQALPADVKVLDVDALLEQQQQSEEGADDGYLGPGDFEADLGEEAARIIIYTSGSSGEPKGVLLPYRSYETNRATFESFLGLETPALRFCPVLVNPLHHTNSTALSDWALRRPGAHLHLFERYTTGYWAVVARVALGLEGQEGELPKRAAAEAVAQRAAEGVRVVCPTVSRHFDFLEALAEEGRLPLAPSLLKDVAPLVTFLIGSAPVGPATVARLVKYLGQLPTIRFGSTETCLQVMGTPNTALDEEAMLEAFRRGWEHQPEGQPPGFWVGRPHAPYTEVMVVEGVDPSDASTFLKECPAGARGYLVTRGRNLMAGYVQGEEATRKAIHTEAGGWYTNLGDVGFYLLNARDGAKDFYWVTRTSNLLIRGGSNYAYEQISAELRAFVERRYGLEEGAVAVAAVGLRLASEHEDDCLVTVELMTEAARGKGPEVLASFVKEAAAAVSKGAKPSRVRLAEVPRNFKGDVNWRALEAAWRAEVQDGGGRNGGDGDGATKGEVSETSR